MNPNNYYPASPQPETREWLAVDNDGNFGAKISGKSIKILALQSNELIFKISLTLNAKIVAMAFSETFECTVFADESGNVFKLDLGFLYEYAVEGGYIEGEEEPVVMEDDDGFYAPVSKNLPVRINSIQTENDDSGSEDEVMEDSVEDKSLCVICQEYIKKNESVIRLKSCLLYTSDAADD